MTCSPSEWSWSWVGPAINFGMSLVDFALDIAVSSTMKQEYDICKQNRFSTNCKHKEGVKELFNIWVSLHPSGLAAGRLWRRTARARWSAKPQHAVA